MMRIRLREEIRLCVNVLRFKTQSTRTTYISTHWARQGLKPVIRQGFLRCAVFLYTPIAINILFQPLMLILQQFLVAIIVYLLS